MTPAYFFDRKASMLACALVFHSILGKWCNLRRKVKFVRVTVSIFICQWKAKYWKQNIESKILKIPNMLPLSFYHIRFILQIVYSEILSNFQQQCKKLKVMQTETIREDFYEKDGISNRSNHVLPCARCSKHVSRRNLAMQTKIYKGWVRKS